MQRSRISQRGFTLLITLLVVILLTIVVLQVRYTTRIERILSENIKRSSISNYAGHSSIPLIMQKLALDMKMSPTTDSLNDIWAKPLSGVEMGDSSVEIRIADEDGKFNINFLVDDDGRVLPPQKKNFIRMLKSMDIEWDDFEDLEDATEIAEKIIDYIDEDHAGRYEDTDNNANRRILMLDELLNIEGFNEKFLYGKDDPFDNTPVEEDPYEEKNYYRGTYQKYAARVAGEIVPFSGLANFITAHSDGMININTAPLSVLVSLDPTMTTELAKALVNYRETTAQSQQAQTLPDGTLIENFQTFGSIKDMKLSTHPDLKAVFTKLSFPAVTAGQGRAAQPVTSNRIKVTSDFFTAIVKTSVDSRQVTYTGIFERNLALKTISLHYWERTMSIPKANQQSNVKEDEEEE